jgi:hypothetical protein
MYSRTIGHVGALLLVEDEPFVREATCCILESAGFEVLTPVASLPCVSPVLPVVKKSKNS